MQSEKMKKIGKWGIIIISCLIIVFFVGWLIWGAMLMMTERRTERESSVYFIFGKGCNHYYNAPGEELKKRIEGELRSISKRRFKEIIEEVNEYGLNDLEKYNSKKSLTKEETDDKNDIEKCLIVKKRALKVINDLK